MNTYQDEVINKGDIIGCLKRIPFLKELNDAQVETVAQYMEHRHYEQDVIIFREDDPGDYVCFIVEGELDVLKTMVGEKDAMIATLGKGTSIGEMSILDDYPRSATVRTRTKCSLLVLHRSDFEKIIDEYPRIGVIVLKGIARFMSLHLRETSNVIVLNEQKKEMIGIAAHDLKNPLGVIMGFSSFIISAKEKISKDKVVKYLDLILQSSEKMLGIIQSLLDVNRIESGGFNIQKERIHLSEIAANVVDTFSRMAEDKKIRLDFIPLNDPPDNDLVKVDRRLLDQILDNLISNALKYSPHGSTVWVRVLASEISVRCEVRDEGPGISEEDMQKMFRQFTRLSAEPTGGEHSSGLGLWIVKKFVGALDGAIWCESELGKGATFIVQFEKVM